VLRRSRWWLTGGAVATAAVVAVATAVNAWSADAGPTRTYSFFTGVDTSRAVLDPDTQPVELGLRFSTSAAGEITAVRYFQAPGDSGAHKVSVWSAGGRQLATVNAPPSSDTAGGWREVRLGTPVRVRANRTFVVSYHTTRYVATTGYFTQPLKAGPLTAAAPENGVYAYGPGGFPTQSYRSSNYWVDVVFSAAAAPTSTPGTIAPTPTTAVPTPTASTAPTTAPPPPPTGNPPVLSLPRVPWNGGPGYYSQFASTAAWNNPNFFPIGVWFESVLTTADTAKDKAAGLNTYVELTSNSSASLVRSAGMYAIPSGLSGIGSETVGHLLTDEPDMIYGPGWDPWSGRWGWNTCQPIQDQGGKCGYTVMQHLVDRAPKDGRPRYANYGKGVMMWESDAQAEVFVNRFQQLVSADMYFYTDPNLCPGEAQRFLNIRPEFCRRSSSYGMVLDRMRMLDATDGRRQPIYGFVEVGHPFTENHAPTINGDQIAGAVMNSIIHEANGIIYFNHNFGGPCHSQHVLRDACGAAIRPKVTETNQRIASLAPVLNTQSYQFSFNANLDTMLKAHGGAVYIFAMPGRNGGTGTQTLRLPAGINASSAEVLFENRRVPISGGQFTDTFAQEFTYHIYKIG
jgi:hypothetical protein